MVLDVPPNTWGATDPDLAQEVRGITGTFNPTTTDTPDSQIECITDLPHPVIAEYRDLLHPNFDTISHTMSSRPIIIRTTTRGPCSSSR